MFGLEAKSSIAAKNDRSLQTEKSLDSKCSKWDELNVLEWGLKGTLLKVRSCQKSAGAWRNTLNPDK